MRRLLTLTLPALVLAALPGGATAQSDDSLRVCVATEPATGGVRGVVLDVVTGSPLQQARVSIDWSGAPVPDERPEQRTDALGTFLFCEIPLGATVVVRGEYMQEVVMGRPVTIATVEGTSVLLSLPAPHIRIRGRIVEAGSGSPIHTAAIRLRGTPLMQTTDEDGSFTFEGVPPGEYDVDVDHLAYTALSDSIVVEAGTNMEVAVRMAPNAIPLEPLRVTVRSLMLERNGFYVRQERGHGTFFTRNDIHRVLRSSDVLRNVSGIQMRPHRSGFGVVPVGRANCGFRYFVDGTRVGPGFEIDDIPPQWIEALEVYKGVSTVPPEFAAFAHENRATCGLIVIWTRNRA
jgi:hypothetical protein